MSGALRIDFRVTGMDDTLAMLRSLPPEIVSKNGGPVRSALRAGAAVIRDAAIANVRRIVAEPNKDGRPSRSTGLLEQSIVVIRGRRGEVAAGTGERFLVWVRRGAAKKYVNNVRNRRAGRASWTGAKTYQTEGPAFYGRFLEYGTRKMRPHQWLRPAFTQKRQEATDVIMRTLQRRLALVIRRLERSRKA